MIFLTLYLLGSFSLFLAQKFQAFVSILVVI